MGGKSVVEGPDIGALLDRSAEAIADWIDAPIHLEPALARYLLSFDPQGSLHIQLYLFDPADFDDPKAACFFPWSYLPASGFWRIEELMFAESKTIIPKNQVADFISRHRHWLHQFPGFQTHFGSLEAHLTYFFDEEGNLAFNAELEFPEQFDEAIDFDEWVYLKGQGFYMKKQNRGRLPLHPGLVVPKRDIGAFLEEHRDELEQVQGFLAAKSPVQKLGLSIQVNEEICTAEKRVRRSL